MKKYPEPESSTVEWKETLPQKNPIYKTVIGFCNQNGGKLILGIKDDYMTTEGLEQGTYVRIGAHTVKAYAAMVEELRWQAKGLHFETMLHYQSSRKDLDEKKIRAFLSSRKNHHKVKYSDMLLKAYHLIAEEHLKYFATNAGLLLFGRNPQHYFSEAMIICTHFRGTSGRDVVATVDCDGTLFDQFESAFAFLLSRLSRSFVIRGAKREETLEIPEEAIREALLNAIIHRNYRQASPMRVSIYDDRVEILSPGTFPGPLDATGLRSGLTFLRNPLICRIFREAGYVEKMGTGLIIIFNSYEKRGLEIPQIFEISSFVKCILPRKTKSKEIVLSEDAENIEKIIATRGEVTMNELVDLLALSKPTIWRRVQELLNQGLIVRVGHTRGARYRHQNRGNSTRRKGE